MGRKPSDSLTVPRTLSLLSALRLFRCSRLPSLRLSRRSRPSFLRLSRRSRPSDFLVSLVPQTFLLLSSLRLSHGSTQYATIFRRHHLQVAATNSPDVMQQWGEYIGAQQAGLTFLSDYKEEISLALWNTRKIRSSTAHSGSHCWWTMSSIPSARPHPDWLQVDGGRLSSAGSSPHLTMHTRRLSVSGCGSTERIVPATA